MVSDTNECMHTNLRALKGKTQRRKDFAAPVPYLLSPQLARNEQVPLMWSLCMILQGVQRWFRRD